MADIPPQIQDAAKQLADMAQRMSMRLAELPLEQREEGFVVAERSMREVAEQLKMPGNGDELVKMLIKGLRQFVLDLDVGGSPKGGNA
jgi:hypothetical protein